MATDINETAELTAEEAAAELSEQNRIRLEKLAILKERGDSPYYHTKYPVTHKSAAIKADFEGLEGTEVYIAGRITSWRNMGKANFIDIRDGEGTIQVYVRMNDIGEDVFKEFKTWDLGDIAGVKGTVFRTKMGEISVHAYEITLLSKSLYPLPEKRHGLKDKEERYRKRYLDLIANPTVKDTFVTRSRIMRELRAFLDNKNFLEVETPVLHTVEIGAAARPFRTHHNALNIDMLLRIETEISLKKLIVGGFDKVYEVGRIFRNEGMDSTHNPEFTTIELYWAYADYFDIMDLVEELYRHLTQVVVGSGVITYRGKEINIGGEWRRLTMKQAVKQYSGVDYDAWQSDEQARAESAAKGLNLDKASKGDCLIALFEAFCEENLIQPTFIYDYPIENSPLAKRKKDEPGFTERFEFFINSWEFGNAFSELNDPVDQRERFVKQAAARKAEGVNVKLDEDFITALEYGLPPTGGLGFGVDRLVMLLTDSASIRDVLFFPTMRPLD
ncbi:MAG: lysine--tRNA ligase [Oscillospiraceae bacterium]|jgi:lysyl-tRNA synthetase class 2|nr:lysine--tRNA ligase [Oscillospiraceae bacterium]